MAALNAMWVAPEARGRRVARALCDACAAWAAGAGCRTVVLEVVDDNVAARRAYEAAGFVVVGRSTWTSGGRTLEELVMSRALPPREAPASDTEGDGTAARRAGPP